jgi:hypothetical protein
MRLPSIQSIGSVALTLLATFDVVYGAGASTYDVSKPKDPKGKLKVALDYSLATSWPEPYDASYKGPRPWTWSSHIVFKDPVEKGITDGQLWQIARDAADEMSVDREQYGIGPRAEPTAMGVLAWGDEIIISSSVKGAGSFSYQFDGGNPEVLKSLKECQILWRDTSLPDKNKEHEHKNKGNCAEPMAAHLYYRNNGKDLPAQNARIGTWVRVGGTWQQIDPCGTGEDVSTTFPTF